MAAFVRLTVGAALLGRLSSPSPPPASSAVHLPWGRLTSHVSRETMLEVGGKASQGCSMEVIPCHCCHTSRVEADSTSRWRECQDPRARAPKCRSERTVWSYSSVYHTSFLELSRFRADTSPRPCRSPCGSHTEVSEGFPQRVTLIPARGQAGHTRAAPHS